MAELSFGHNVRAKKKEVEKSALNLLPWAQGCLGGMVGGSVLSMRSISFAGAPAKMLGVALHEYGNPKQFKVQLCNLPRELGDSEVLVQVFMAGLNPTDAKLRGGGLQQLYPLSLPVVLGCDLSGVVLKAGKDARFKVGQKVFGRQSLERIRDVGGTYAEYCVVDSNDLWVKPDSLTFEEAAAIPFAALTAMAGLCVAGGLSPASGKDGGLRSVLVLGGSGGVGTFAVQLAKKHLGCRTIATCSGPNVELVESLGADQVVDYSQDGFWAEIDVPETGTGKRGFSVVLDCVGGDDYWQASQALLADDGVYVTLVGPERYGGDGKVSVGSALNTQLQSGLRKGLGMLGAGKRYTVRMDRE